VTCIKRDRNMPRDIRWQRRCIATGASTARYWPYRVEPVPGSAAIAARDGATGRYPQAIPFNGHAGRSAGRSLLAPFSAPNRPPAASLPRGSHKFYAGYQWVDPDLSPVPGPSCLPRWSASFIRWSCLAHASGPGRDLGRAHDPEWPAPDVDPGGGTGFSGPMMLVVMMVAEGNTRE
jgi:hypothetical protein